MEKNASHATVIKHRLIFVLIQKLHLVATSGMTLLKYTRSHTTMCVDGANVCIGIPNEALRQLC